MKQDCQRVPRCPGPDLTYVTDKSDESRGFKFKILNKNPTCMTLIFSLGFSNLRSVPFGIIDDGGLREVKTTCETLINKLISWLIRCEV